ncbi:MAG: D-amino-acid transaminase [Pseudomonadota bacterium]
MKCLVGTQLIDESDARISPFDRGYLFADGIYEVIAIIDSKMLDAQRHWDRLERSCGEIDLPLPMAMDELKGRIAGLIEANGVTEGRVYFQITRGVAERDFAFPETSDPQLFAFVRQTDLVNTPAAHDGIAAVTVPDLRWKRRDIKSIALLPQTMAKQIAKQAGAGEAIMVEDGFITEGSSSTIHMIKGDRLITRQLSNDVLPGVTRASIFDVCADLKIAVEERPFTPDEAAGANELFLTSAGALVQGITSLDGKPIGEGKVGPVTQLLRNKYIELALQTAD